MRREGNIIEEVVEYSNMTEAFDTVLHGTARKRSRVGKYLMEHREEVIEELEKAYLMESRRKLTTMSVLLLKR